MTLQDYYHDLAENVVGPPHDSDEWALEFLGVPWLEAIMEAFDDDASGYVTIAEVNKLMDLRPVSLSWRCVLELIPPHFCLTRHLPVYHTGLHTGR